ncbi:unnamed protein product [Cyprideis torosa]|uniref:Uncharacterized protein n=1 Tax=Cyprideis torosa TaxID=163714 RepID=A0A7R8WA00_9CRUS|nr:unnamed protein product [Cyprideis torosa]CAG0890407.1 unnamed protein product [Cyprideis torosa]
MRFSRSYVVIVIRRSLHQRPPRVSGCSALNHVRCFSALSLRIRPDLDFRTGSMTMESPSEKRPKFVHSWNFDKLKPENVNQRLEEIIEYAKEAFDSVGSLPLDAVTYENTIQVLANVTAKTSTDVYPLIFIRVSSTNPELREASTEAQKKFEGFEVEMSMRKDIFDRICEFEKKFGTESLSPEASRYVKKLIRDGKRCGLHLDEEVRKEIKSIKKKISDLEVNFQRNIVEDKTFLLLSAEELAGLPQDFIDSLEKVDGKSKVTMQYPHYFPVVKKCTVAATRQKVDTAFQSRCMKENVPILEELIQLRHKQAQLLGYPNHATYIQEIRMAKKPETVETFLTELSRKLQPLWAKEREMFLQLKKEQCEASGEVFVSKINIWDMQFLSTLVEEKFYQVS